MPKLIGRSRGALVHSFMALLPSGAVWPRDAGSTLVRVVTGLMGLPERFLTRVAYFLNVEAFPPTSLQLLPDWERVLGLPEPCLPAAQTIPERQAAVAEKLARRPGRQDRPYFVELAARLGYAITITEHVPAQCGLTPCGAYRRVEDSGRLIVRGGGCGTPFIRYLWIVSVPGPRLTWFAFGFGGGRAGQDPHLRIRRADDLECLFKKLKPAHTRLVFNYTGI